MKTRIFIPSGVVITLLSLFLVQVAVAGSATWNLNPTSGDWNTAANWTPNTVPDNPSDTATFDVSDITDISVTPVIDVAEIIFDPGASGFTISSPGTLNLHGAGVTNNSGVEQNFIVPGLGAEIHFYESATAGEDTVFTQTGPSSVETTIIAFHQTSSAGSATFISEGNAQASSGTWFFDSATAGNGMFINQPGDFNGGDTIFFDGATAANATFDCLGGTGSQLAGRVQFAQRSTAADATIVLESSLVSYSSTFVLFSNRSSGGNARITVNGGTAHGSYGGYIEMTDTPTLDNATIILNGGTNGGTGGRIYFEDGSQGGTAQLKLSGNATLDMNYHDPGSLSIGSLAGTGLVLLAATNLTVGTNNFTTEFAGNIRDNVQPPFASVTKTGSGNLALSGANAYGGGTFVQGKGTLFVNNVTGSGTGTGTVQVNSGVLGGNGLISGPVVVGNGIPSAARFMPGRTERSPGVLTISNALTFNADGVYLWLLNSVRAIASSVVTKGVTIDSAAIFAASELQSGTLSAGTVFTVISNGGSAAIVGTFANLPDGGTIVIGSNTYQVNYAGGDGNDLTLTVL